MYSLNEQVGHMCTNEAHSRAAREDHWRRSMNRSVSVDAVDTGTRGFVRSNAYKQTDKYRKNSTHSESKYFNNILNIRGSISSLRLYDKYLITNNKFSIMYFYLKWPLYFRIEAILTNRSWDVFASPKKFCILFFFRRSC